MKEHGLKSWLWPVGLLVILLGVFSLGLTAQDAQILLENDQVRVRRVILEPGVAYREHTHTLPHVGVIVKGGTLEFHEGGKVETVTFQAGDAGWREAGVTHRIVNRSPDPVHVVEVEIK